MDPKNKLQDEARNEFSNKVPLFGSIFSAIFYGTCSTSMAFINKAVISSYEFNFPYFIMVCQMVLTIATLELCRFNRCLSLPTFTISRGLSLFWPSLFYAAHSVTALFALSGMSIPMYAAVKRCSPIVTMVTSVMLLHRPFPNINIILSVCLITFGCLLAGFGDLQFDLSAYVFGAVSCLVQGLYLTLVQKGAENASALQILHVNSYNTLPIFIIFSIIHDASGIMNFQNFKSSGFLLCFSLQLVVGVLLNFSLFHCTANNSALTTSIVGVMKSMLQTAVGMFTFGGMEFNVLNVVGILLNSFGSIVYVYSKYKEKSVTPRTPLSSSRLV